MNRIWLKGIEEAARWRKGFDLDGVAYLIEVRHAAVVALRKSEEQRNDLAEARYQARKACRHMIHDLHAPAWDLIDALHQQRDILTPDGRALLAEFVQKLETREEQIINGWMASFENDA